MKALRVVLVLLAVIFLANFAISQVSLSICEKVQVGMSGDDVKKVVGFPQAVDGGFPDDPNSIVRDLPKQKGQLNYSTWFYLFSTIKTLPLGASGSRTTYTLNGGAVSEQIYDDYVNKDTLFYNTEGHILPLFVAQNHIRN